MFHNRRTILLLLAAGMFLGDRIPDARAAEPGKPGQLRVYFGTYTWKKPSKGIYMSCLDLADGSLRPIELAAELTSPSFLTLHPSRPLLYAVGEIGSFAGKKAGAVSALAVDAKTGKLTLLNQQPSGGAGPCHVAVDRGGRNVLVANYSGGSIACLPIRADGSLDEPSSIVQHQGSGFDPKRQQGPHAHSIGADPAGRFVLAADLGLDKLFVYRLDAAGKLTANDPPYGKVAPGAGPRHFAFHPSGRFVYVINEMHSTVTAFRYDAARGAMEQLQTISTLPAGFAGPSTTAEIEIHPSGKFLYGSNRGHDSIAAFTIDQGTGRLQPGGHTSTQGRAPRNFAIDPTGAYLVAANQDSDNVVVFRIDGASGALRPTGQSLSVPLPVCVTFARAESGN